MNTTTIATKQPFQRIRPMDVTWAAWVRDINYNPEQHTWDFIGIYDTISKHNKSDFPFSVDLQLIVSYTAKLPESKKTFNLKLEILDLDKPIFSIEENIVLPEFLDKDIQWYQDYKIENVVFKEPGDYFLYILVDNQEKQSVPLHIHVPKAVNMDKFMKYSIYEERWIEDLGKDI